MTPLRRITRYPAATFITAALLVICTWSVADPDNPPVDCGCCECYDLEELNLVAGGTTVEADTSETTEVSPDVEGQISLILELPDPLESCEDCDETDLTVMVTDANGKQQTGTATLNANEWESPLSVTVECYRVGGFLSVCKTYNFSIKSCEPCATGCTTDSGGSGTSPPSGGLSSGDGDAVEMKIPTGISGFGESKSSLKLRIDTTDNPGRSALKTSGWDGMPKSGDGGGIKSVTTKSSIAKIETTETNDDSNAFTVTISHDPDNAATSEFRTVLVEKLVDGTLKATVDAFSKERVMTWSKSGNIWTFFDGNGAKKVEKTIISESATARTERLTEYERDPDNSSSYLPVSDEITEHEKHGGTWVMVRKRIDPYGVNLVSTWTYYEVGELTGPSSYIGAGRLKNHDRHDGYYERHNYYMEEGSRVHMVEMPYAATTMVRTSSWNPGNNTLTQTDTVNHRGTKEISRTETEYETNRITVRLFTDSINNPLTTITDYWAPGTEGKGGRVKKITRPDQTISTYDYEKSGSGNSEMLEITERTGAASGGIVIEGTQTLTRINVDGVVEEVETTAISAGNGNGITLNHWVASVEQGDRDALGRAKKIIWFPTFNSSWETTRAYACCGLASESDKYGNLNQYEYDDLGRLIRTNRLKVTEAVKYKGLTVSNHRYPETVTGGSFVSSFTNEISRTVNNLSGTVTTTWGPSPQSGALANLSTTTKTYRNPLGTLVNLGTGIGTRIVTEVIQVEYDGTLIPKQTELRHYDGKSYRSWGDLEPAVQVLHYANSAGPYSVNCYLEGISPDGTGGTPREYSYEYLDYAGRVKRSVKTGVENTYYHYNSLGQLERTVDADLVNTRYVYNSRGERTVTALKLDTNTGSITYGTDRITSTETMPALREVGTASIDVIRTVTKVWRDDDDSGVTGGTEMSVIDRTPDGLTTWIKRNGVTNDSETTTTLSAGGDWTVTTVHSDNSKTVESHIGGLWDNTEHMDSLNTVISWTAARKFDDTSGYDTLNRLTHLKDSRTGTVGVTQTQYRSAISDVVTAIIPPAGVDQKTAYVFDHRGRRVEVDAPQSSDAEDDELDNRTFTSYYPDGSVHQISGQQAYPVSHTYDYAGRKKTITTDGDAGEAITAWNYSTTSGLLMSKRHNSNLAGATGTGPDYTYTPAGRLQTRSWARNVTTGIRVKATHSYNHGLLTSVTYNDGTPDVTYDYDAFTADNNHIPGDLETVTRGGVTWTYKYDSATLRLKTETHPVFENTYERVLTRHSDAAGRDDGFELGTDADPDLDHAVTYDYDSAGRFDEVSSDGKVFTYGYEDDSSHLISTVTGPADMLVTNTWDTARDVINVKKNEVDSATISQFTYGVNHLGQRDGVATTGSAFGNTNRGWAWGYDQFGQATKAVNAADTDLNRAYVFDSIGNRTSATDGDGEEAVTTGYTPNKLNQYQSINPGSTVNPVHDLDGNLREDLGVNAMGYGLKYEWDAENRIIAVRKADDTLLANYEYDHLGRRIRTTTTAAAYQGASDIAYFYDGWNVVAEYRIEMVEDPIEPGQPSPEFMLHTKNIWGLDLSGTLQGAGGVGGLLATGIFHGAHQGYYYPTFDGNGNVSEYLDSDGDEAVHFEYDPFGRLAVEPTEQILGISTLFTYRFSTKPLAFESGLYYYLYRYYDPVTGRWPSRDPIEEEGGINLYGFVGNSGVNYTDLLGMVNTNENRDQGRRSFDVFGDFGKKLRDLADRCCKCSQSYKDSTRIANKVKKIWEDNYGKGRHKEGQDPVGGYYCFHWARAFAEGIKKAVEGDCWTAELKWASQTFYSKKDQKMVEGIKVHFYVVIKASGKKGADSDSCEIIIDDGYLNGDFVHESKGYGEFGEKKDKKVVWKEYNNGDEMFELYNKYDKKWNPPINY